jgi:hypothetical protein
MTQAHAQTAQTPRTQQLPLYLLGKNPTRVETDGPALLVRTQHKSPLRYPFARIARVIAAERVEWQARALAACQHEGTPIVFLDGAGNPAGYLLPAQGKPSRLDSVLEEILERPDWQQHYRNWLRARRMQRLKCWLQAQQDTGRECDSETFRERVRQHVYRAETESAASANDSMQTAAITAYVLQTLHRAGLKPRYWGNRGEALELATDLVSLLELALELEKSGLGAAAHGNPAAMLRIMQSFAGNMPKLLPELLGSLHRHLKSQLEEWR